MKQIVHVQDSPHPHWVGDGFLVRSVFSYVGEPRERSPFLLLDYGAPMQFSPTTGRRGVGAHPHRGFETVTIAYSGEIEHRDSSGGGGKIGPGDVQWMTASSGIVHDEYHSPDFSSSGGALEMVQLWVNLPAKDKMSPPKYQSIGRADIPTVPLPDDAGSLRVIAGETDGYRGPADTFTEINVWDVRLLASKKAVFEVKEGHTAMVVVLSGTVMANAERILRGTRMVLFDRKAGTIVLEANSDSKVLVLTGEPILEPVVGQGPFVMNSAEEIQQAFVDYNAGRFAAP